MIRTTVLFALTIPVAAPAQAPNQHPNPMYVLAPAVPRVSIALTASPTPVPFRLGNKARVTVGSESDAEEATIGDILDGVWLPGGNIAILDDKLFRLRVYGSRGEAREVIGRDGGGPGEFYRRLLSLTADPQGTLYVADLSRSVKLFPAGPTGHSYSRAIPMEISVKGMCLLDSLLVVNGTVLGKRELIHIYRLDGTKVRSFAEFYASREEMLNTQFNEGHLACDPQRKLIYFATASAIGEIRAYRPTGEAVWWTTIDGFHSSIIIEEDNGFSSHASEDGVDNIFQFTLLPKYGLLAQVRHRSPADLRAGAWYTTLTSFLVDPGNGAIRSLGPTLPAITAATASDVLVVSEDPVPRFEVRSLDGK